MPRPSFLTGMNAGQEKPEVIDHRYYGWFMILTGLVGAVIGGFMTYEHLDTLQAYVKDPVPVSFAQLARAESPEDLPSPYVSLPSRHFIDTGVRRNIGRRRLEVHYVLVPVGKRFLLAEVHFNTTSGTPLTGHLDDWGASRHASNVLDEVKRCGYADRLLPFQMCAVRGGGLPVDAAYGPLLILGGLVFVCVGFPYTKSEPRLRGAWE